MSISRSRIDGAHKEGAEANVEIDFNMGTNISRFISLFLSELFVFIFFTNRQCRQPIIVNIQQQARA